MWELTGRLCPCSTDRKSGRTAIIPGFCKCLRSVRFRGIVVAEPPVHARQASDLVEAFEGVLMLPGFSVLREISIVVETKTCGSSHEFPCWGSRRVCRVVDDFDVVRDHWDHGLGEGNDQTEVRLVKRRFCALSSIEDGIVRVVKAGRRQRVWRCKNRTCYSVAPGVAQTVSAG